MFKLEISDKKRGALSLLLYFFLMLSWTIIIFVEKYLYSNTYEKIQLDVIRTSVIVEVIIIVFLLFLWREELKKSFLQIKEGKIWRFMLVVTAFFILACLINIILYKLILPEISNKEEEINKYMEIIIAIGVLVTAPILEEIVFRLAIFKVFENIFLSSLISILLFDVLHITDYSNFFIEFLHYLPLSAIITLLYAYKKNVIYTMSLHFLINFSAWFLILK